MSDWSTISLLWQYEYGSRWISHTKQKLEAINKAFNKGKKSITLTDKDPKKQVVLHFEKMYQKNKISGSEQRIRCCVFNEDFYTWQWKDDKDWNSYAPAISLELEIAFTSKKSVVKFVLKHEQEVDLIAFKQKSIKNGKVYDVKREKIEIGEKTSAIKQIALAFTSYLDVKCQQFDNSESERLHTKKIKLDQSEPVKNEIVVEYVFRGSVPVDPACKQLKNVHVYNEGPENVYDAMLNFTDLTQNNNKFYRMQILQQDVSNKFYAWFHWGRVGANGQNKLIPCESLDDAKLKFITKFELKTNNAWSDRHHFTKYYRKYDLVKVDYGLQDRSLKQETEKKPEKSKLHPKIRVILEMISNTDEITKNMIAMKYDIKKAPLGKLTKDQIKAGYSALEQIELLIKNKAPYTRLLPPNNDFYTRIPHDFGMKIPPAIRTLEEVQEKMELLDTLSNIEVTVGIKNDCDLRGESLLDFMYKMIACDLKPIKEDDDMYEIIKLYLHGNAGPTHNNYVMEIINIYECYKSSEEANFEDVGNKTLLWHGSRMTNFVSILKRGLLIAPPEAPSTGYMFGKGLYFADVSTKSANYCHATRKNNSGLLLLCEVALGEQNILYTADENAALNTKKNRKHSVKAIGKYIPQEQETIVKSGIKIPLGGLCANKQDEKINLYYNEYVIYNRNQVKLKYLLHVKFHFHEH